MKPAPSFGDLAGAGRHPSSPAADDVSITLDGRRLDDKVKALAFLAEMDGARESGVTLGPPLP